MPVRCTVLIAAGVKVEAGTRLCHGADGPARPQHDPLATQGPFAVVVAAEPIVPPAPDGTYRVKCELIPMSERAVTTAGKQ